MMLPHAFILTALTLCLLTPVFGFFRRRGGGAGDDRREPEPVPAWAAFFTHAQFDRFLDTVRLYFTSRHIDAHVDDGLVRCPGHPEMPGEMGLANLAQVCHRADAAEWETIVAGHFGSLRKARHEHDDLEPHLADFSRVQDLLGVRIGSAESLGPHVSKLITRDDLPGTYSFLVLDLPNAIYSVPPERAAKWGKSPDELFGIGLANLRTLPSPDVEHVEVDEGVELFALTASHFFAATHVLTLYAHPQCIGPHGSLVAIPHRHLLLCHPIHTIDSAMAVHRIGLLASQMEREGPGSITARIYYRYPDGRFLDLPYEMTDDQFIFRPPDEFMTVLNGLPESGRKDG